MSLRHHALLLTCLTALLAIVGAWSGEPILDGLWRLPLGLLLAGLAYEGWTATRAQLCIAVSADARAVLGRAQPVRFAVSHRLTRAIAIEFARDAPVAVEMETGVQSIVAPPGKTTPALVYATPQRLGRHAWPPVRARIAGPLGLAWWSMRLPTDFVLDAAPDMLRTDAQRFAACTGGTKPRAMRGAGAEILQLRDYRPGDPLQLIDWKATARGGRLVTREFGEDQHLDIVIAVDAGRASALRVGDLDRLGHFANITARFAEHASAHEDRVGLLLFADRPLVAIAPGRGAASVRRIREALAAAASAPGESNPLNAALRIRSLVRHRSLIVMLTDLDDATVAGQLSSAVRLLTPKHLPLIAGLASPDAERMAHAPARTWLEPYESLAAQEYCALLERNVRALRALGAPAVLARPDQLERAVFDAYAQFRRRRQV